MSVLIFCVLLITGRMPAIGYAEDHGYAMLMALVVVGIFGLIEMLFVLSLARHLQHYAPVRRRLVQLLGPSNREWVNQLASGPRPYVGLAAIAGLPAFGGLWVALALSLKIGLGLKRALLLLSISNAVWFEIYRTALGQYAWYIAGSLILIAMASLIWSTVVKQPTQSQLPA